MAGGQTSGRIPNGGIPTVWGLCSDVKAFRRRAQGTRRFQIAYTTGKCNSEREEQLKCSYTHYCSRAGVRLGRRILRLRKVGRRRRRRRRAWYSACDFAGGLFVRVSQVERLAMTAPPVVSTRWRQRKRGASFRGGSCIFLHRCRHCGGWHPKVSRRRKGLNTVQYCSVPVQRSRYAGAYP